MVDGFRINMIKTNKDIFKNKTINLVNKDHNNNKNNYYTVIIGNNGTGKSILLSIIAKKFKANNSEVNISYDETDVIGKPSKVIAISNSINDKFPMDYSSRNIEKYSKLRYKDFYYVYLGQRARNNFFSTSAQINKTLEILIESYNNNLDAKNLRCIFEYLKYEPIIKITYGLTKNILSCDSNNSIINLLEQNSIGNYNHNYDELLKKYKISVQEIINFVKYHMNCRNKENKLILNFSEKNIRRMVRNNNIYEYNVKNFKIVQVLKKMKFIKGFRIKLFTHSGVEINFKEASSGEVAILSTLIALVPLISNNSLILIDEPEISLHPYWQSQYIPLLQKIMSNVKGCHVIIATHSHFMLSDIPINNSSVITFKRNGNDINTELIKLPTYGWSAEDILLNVFELPTTRNYYLSQLITDALVMLKDRKSNTIEFKEITEKILGYYPFMKDNDPLKKIISSIIYGGNKNV